MMDDIAPDWSARALNEVLCHLRISTVTEGRSVSVDSSWTDGPTAFCVVYRVTNFDGLIGLRRVASDARVAIESSLLTPVEAEATTWDHHNRMTDGYDMSDAVVLAGGAPDPIAFGRNVADFDIGEPHEPAPSDPIDEFGVYWHGSLSDGIPTRPHEGDC